MTGAGEGTPHERAMARVRDLLDEPLREAVEAGFMVVVPLRQIVEAVQRELGDDAMLLPRYHPEDEDKAWLLGQDARVDPATGQPVNVYGSWKTLPHGRMRVRISDAKWSDPPVLVEFIAAADALPHPLRMLIAGCQHSTATGSEGAE